MTREVGPEEGKKQTHLFPPFGKAGLYRLAGQAGIWGGENQMRGDYMEERRSFIKKSGLLFLTAAGLAVGGPGKTRAGKGRQWGMIIDLNRCMGCQSCVIACKAHSGTVEGKFNTSIQEVGDGFSSGNRRIFTPVQCNQCANPPCVEACPEKATYRLENGIVITDWDKCKGKGNCVSACPYGARYLDPRFGNRADKCDFCHDRVEQGNVPVCVESCPSSARLFGDLNDPSGEFARYLRSVKRTQLVSPGARYSTEPHIQYVLSRHSSREVI